MKACLIFLLAVSLLLAACGIAPQARPDPTISPTPTQTVSPTPAPDIVPGAIKYMNTALNISQANPMYKNGVD